MTFARALFEVLLDPIDQLLVSLPIEVARFVVIAMLITPVALTFLARRSFFVRGAPDLARWRDLRWWALLITLPYLLVYWWL